MSHCFIPNLLVIFGYSYLVVMVKVDRVLDLLFLLFVFRLSGPIVSYFSGSGLLTLKTVYIESYFAKKSI